MIALFDELSTNCEINSINLIKFMEWLKEKFNMLENDELNFLNESSNWYLNFMSKTRNLKGSSRLQTNQILSKKINPKIKLNLGIKALKN